jgi:hypothetical protein
VRYALLVRLTVIGGYKYTDQKMLLFAINAEPLVLLTQTNSLLEIYTLTKEKV